jgi:hypothetical protein
VETNDLGVRVIEKNEEIEPEYRELTPQEATQVAGGGGGVGGTG